MPREHIPAHREGTTPRWVQPYPTPLGGPCHPGGATSPAVAWTWLSSPAWRGAGRQRDSTAQLSDSQKLAVPNRPAQGLSGRAAARTPAEPAVHRPPGSSGLEQRARSPALSPAQPPSPPCRAQEGPTHPPGCPCVPAHGHGPIHTPRAASPLPPVSLSVVMVTEMWRQTRMEPHAPAGLFGSGQGTLPKVPAPGRELRVLHLLRCSPGITGTAAVPWAARVRDGDSDIPLPPAPT